MALPAIPVPARLNKTAETAIAIGFLSTRIIFVPVFLWLIIEHHCA
jgi:2-keto-3-deoxy-galactonokinase